jgi:adenosylcobyric acid synthase
MELEGYEIHMGVSTAKENISSLTDIFDSNDSNHIYKNDGVYKNNVYGYYVHGIFDKDCISREIIKCLANKKGISMDHLKSMDYTAYKETQYDLLADTLRAHLDMKKIYEILEMGV